MRDILTKDELADLLAPAAEDESEAALSRADHHDTLVLYLQETVAEMQREIARLRDRVESLERRANAASASKSAAAKKPADSDAAPAAATPQLPALLPEPQITLSRVERHRAQKGKWF